MRKLAFILALLACSPLYWQPLRGQAPRVGKEASSKKKNVPADGPNKPTADQRGTKESPLVIDTEGHHETPAEAEDKAREKEIKDKIDYRTLLSAEITAGATVILMLVGIGGVCAALLTLKAIERQAESMEQQAKESRESAAGDMAIAQKAADAALASAELSKQSLQVTQRAFFTFARYQTLTMFEKPNNEGNFLGFRFVIEYENVGKTPAIDAEMILGLFRIKSGEPEHVIVSDWEHREGPRISSTIAPGMKVTGMLEIKPEDARQIASGDLSVFIYTQARYRDVFTDTPVHGSGTCVKLVKIADLMSGSPFQFKLHSPEHNYGD